jgi:hypothetical protein
MDKNLAKEIALFLIELADVLPFSDAQLDELVVICNSLSDKEYWYEGL